MKIRIVCPRCKSPKIEQQGEVIWVCHDCKANVPYPRQDLVRER